MEKPPTPIKLLSKKGMIFNLVLAGLWFAFFSVILRPYVPAQTETYQVIIAIFTSACLTGVFWMAISMFSVVLADQKNRAND